LVGRRCMGSGNSPYLEPLLLKPLTTTKHNGLIVNIKKAWKGIEWKMNYTNCRPEIRTLKSVVFILIRGSTYAIVKDGCRECWSLITNGCPFMNPV